MEHRIRKIIKRDGRTVDFDINKIATAIYKAAEVLGGNNAEMAMNLAEEVEKYLVEVCHNEKPTVEEIQDAVEKVLKRVDEMMKAGQFLDEGEQE